MKIELYDEDLLQQHRHLNASEIQYHHFSAPAKKVIGIAGVAKYVGSSGDTYTLVYAPKKSRNAVKNEVPAGWIMYEAGWWVNLKVRASVCKELDGKWHSYATDADKISTSPSFATRSEAMHDAEKRAEETRSSGGFVTY